MQIIDLDPHCVIKWRLTDLCNYQCSYCIRRPLANTEQLIQDDFTRCINALPEVLRIAKELHEKNNKPIKIDLIGGEISIFNHLHELMEALYQSEIISAVDITTNLSRSSDYYEDLCKLGNSYNKEFSLTASFHCEFAELYEFMSKCNVVHDIIGKNFKCETVITNKNTQVDKFIQSCREIGCYYMCEEDLFDHSKRGQGVKNFKSGYRYLVVDDEGGQTYYTTRNEVVKTFGKAGVAIDTRGLRCTRDYDYVYIEKDEAIPCHGRVPVSTYSISNSPHVCGFGKCTLCGHMSVMK